MSWHVFRLSFYFHGLCWFPGTALQLNFVVSACQAFLKGWVSKLQMYNNSSLVQSKATVTLCGSGVCWSMEFRTSIKIARLAVRPHRLEQTGRLLPCFPFFVFLLGE